MISTILNDLRQQFGEVRRTLVMVYLPVLALLVVIGLQPWVDIPTFVRDTVQLPAGEYYVGIVSDIGMYIWTAALAICALSSYVLFRLGGRDAAARFLAFSALFSAILLVDDRLMIHDEYVPGGEVLYAAYVLGMAYHIYYHREQVLKSRYIYLVIALFFLGLSISIDATKDFMRFLDKQDDMFESFASLFGTTYIKAFNFSFLLEDGAKLLGIVGWLLFCTSFSIQALLRLPSAQTSASVQDEAVISAAGELRHPQPAH